MADLLASYTKAKNKFDENIQIALPGSDQIRRQLELLYRIEVLEACRLFVITAPRSTDPKDLSGHYRTVDVYFQNLSAESRHTPCADTQIQKQRETAHDNLQRVIHDYRQRFANFTTNNDTDCYRNTITNTIKTVLPVWLQYRQAYTEISKEACNEQ